ncbi:hypothetical protein [Tsukamurella sp. NPDC003166]|uniref:variant leucine-rich repeat-containing protein n=1 Tax=Tsukamurella sp. NPDC003166 TaxID=3154444 RepID=UPI0033B564A1
MLERLLGGLAVGAGRVFVNKVAGPAVAAVLLVLAVIAFNSAYTVLPGLLILLCAVVVLIGGAYVSGLFHDVMARVSAGTGPAPAMGPGPAPFPPSAGGALPPAEVAASNPATPQQHLDEIAHNLPALRVAVAANPSTPPHTLQFLSGLGDPAVDAALRQRH